MSENLAVLLAALAGAAIGLIAGFAILSRGIEARVRSLLEARLVEMDRSGVRAPAIVAKSGETARPEPVERRTLVSAPAPTPVAAPSQPAASIAANGGGPELIAVLTAAAFAVIGQPVVLRYALLLADDHHTSWRLVGRTDIFLSHNLRRVS